LGRPAVHDLDAEHGPVEESRRFYRPLSHVAWPADVRLAAELRRVFARQSVPRREWVAGRTQGRSRGSNVAAFRPEFHGLFDVSAPW